ncbi:YbbR-like domain-containing protein [Acetoanaerobium noterae]|uniref:CdaR family protein n=1 Tax=Acetoanaerobium noterae TaxID=745369 RepID=UPI0028A62FD4|nr:CdaR family protein [Acetoanaerobium noterae]
MKTLLNQNLKMKIFAVIFAFFMWIYVMAEVDPIIIRDIDSVPINITNMQELELLELTPEYGTDLNVRVSLRGRRSILNAQITRGIKAEGLINNPKEGENILVVDLKDVDSNVEYTLYPSDKQINLEKKMVIRKSVSVVQTGTLPEGYEIKEIKSNPASMYIEGPKTLVDSITTLMTTLDVSNYDKDFSKKLQVIPVDRDNQEVKGVSINQDTVFVHAIVVKTKTVPIVLDIPNSENDELKLSGYTIDPPEVVIKGKANIIDSIKEIKTEKVELSQLVENPNLKVKLVMPTGVETQTPEITLKSSMEKVISKEFNISKERIQISGNGQLPDISDNPDISDFIAVKITTTDKIMDTISENDIRVYIKMQEYQNNPARVPIHVEVDEEVESIETTPLYLNLEG